MLSGGGSEKCGQSLQSKAFAGNTGNRTGGDGLLRDSFNDISMLRYAGLGVAMANAREQVKDVANYITERDNDHDGVAEVIERFFQEDWQLLPMVCRRLLSLRAVSWVNSQIMTPPGFFSGISGRDIFTQLDQDLANRDWEIFRQLECFPEKWYNESKF